MKLFCSCYHNGEKLYLKKLYLKINENDLNNVNNNQLTG